MAHASRLVRYGDHGEQLVEVHDGGSPEHGPRPVVVLVHGGFWRSRYRYDLMTPLAEDLASRGFTAWNIEYRRVGSNDGDPMTTLDDVRRAIDALLEDSTVDPTRTAFVGHSAGGHLALWAGGSATVRVRPRIVIGQAPVSDVVRSAGERLGDGATQDFLGGEPDQVVEHYRQAQPTLDAERMHLVHGIDDDTVPVAHTLEAVDQLGRPIPHSVLAATDHMDVIDPESEAWAVQRSLLTEALTAR